MSKILLKLVVIIMVSFFLAAGIAYAVGPGKTVEYAGGGQGKVVFDGKIHADKGGKCGDCHPKVFGPMAPHKERMKITKADHVAGKLCGTCHDGKKAFGQEKPEECAKCHKK